MELVTKELERKLKENWRDQDGKRPPVLKLFSPAGAATWIIHSMDPNEPDLLFGLCDLGMGCPELGYVSLTELQKVNVPVNINLGGPTGQFTVSIERDLYFQPSHSLEAYALAASHHHGITKQKEHLNLAERSLGVIRH